MPEFRSAEYSRPSILVVDDDPDDRAWVAEILGGRYRVELVGDAHEARARLIGTPPDLLLCDIYMPGESGIELAESILRTRRRETAVVMVTGADSQSFVDRALELGAYGYLVKPYRAGDLIITVENALRRRRLEITAHEYERHLLDDVVSTGLENRRAHQLLAGSAELLERSLLEMARRLALAVERRDQIGVRTEIGEYAGRIARTLGLPAEISGTIDAAAELHDLGMIAVPEAIVLKAGSLTPVERERVELHTEVGRQLLDSESPVIKLSQSIAWTHHERFDGSGYPRGLRGDQIPIEGRIAAVADVFDALTHDRPYREAMPRSVALEIMREGRGSRFDPEVLDALLGDEPEPTAAPDVGHRVRRLFSWHSS